MSVTKDKKTNKWMSQIRVKDWTGKEIHKKKRGFDTKKEPDFYSWKYKTLIMRADCEDGNITPEEYEAWNEEYFPNRTKK